MLSKKVLFVKEKKKMLRKCNFINNLFMQKEIFVVFALKNVCQHLFDIRHHKIIMSL